MRYSVPLRAGSRRRDVSGAWGIFCRAAVRQLGVSGAEVARFLGVTTAAVNQVVAADGEPGSQGQRKYLSEPTFPFTEQLPEVRRYLNAL